MNTKYRILTTFNTKGGVGKSLVLQQLIMPATCLAYQRKIVYVDTDAHNLSSERIKNSEFVKEIIVQPISQISEMEQFIDIIAKLYQQNDIILVDIPAAKDSQEALNLLYQFNDETFIFIVDDVMQKDPSARENTMLCLNTIQSLGISNATILNRYVDDDDKDHIIMPLIDIIKNFVFSEAKTIYEIDPQPYEFDLNNISKRSFARMCDRIYKPKIIRQIEKVKRLIS